MRHREHRTTRRKYVAMWVYSRVHKMKPDGWWLAEKIIWPIFIRRYP